MKRSDNIRCIREYKRKDGSITYHVEVRRKRAKPLRKTCKTLTEAKNWVRSTESAILEDKLPQETKARKYTVNDLIEQYETIYLSRYPKRIRSQVHHLAWWREHYRYKLLSDAIPSLLAQAKHSLLSETTIRKTPRSGPTVNRYFTTLSKAFSLASSEWEWIKENPVRRVLPPMPDQIYNFLKSWNSSNQDENYLFPSQNPSKRPTYNMIRKAFQTVLKQLGLKDIVFHSLRPTAASHLAMSGATQGELMEVLGHRSPVMTRRYAHFNKAHLAKLFQKTNSNLNIPGENENSTS